MLFVSLFVSMMGMMIPIISPLPPSLLCFQNIVHKSCLDSGYRPTVGVYLLKFELSIPGLWRGEPFGHSPVPGPACTLNSESPPPHL